MKAQALMGRRRTILAFERYPTTLYLLTIGALALSAGVAVAANATCALTGDQAPSALAGYDFSADDVRHIELPRPLHEISGLALDATDGLFAHHDERATVFRLDPADGRILSSFNLGRRGRAGDFEGIALAGSRFFLVTSDGRLLESGHGEDGATVEFDEIRIASRRVCAEIEGLEYDAPGNALLLACKFTEGRALRDRLVILRFSLRSRTLDAEPFISLPVESLEPFGLGSTINPSGIAIHPLTGTIIVLAARQRAIVELDRNGSVLGAARLRRRYHAQAEGIAVTRDGTLIIADEGDSGTAKLTYYAYRPVAGGR
ncbi:MAG TPA: SdiA-regulated domain-containing protein [Longimicrobiales bacterium]|nr:SdiA-regulated domain-containing protein [Longimicrobiales bacterium]